MSTLPILPPPLPDWGGLHPLIVHFPIALLLVAPLFVLLGFLPRAGGGFRMAALVLLILGTAGAYVAVETGEASAQVVSFDEAAAETLNHHADLAETARLLFTILTVAYATILALPLLVRKLLKKTLPRPVPPVLTILVLVYSGLCASVLANAAHLGGKLVYVHRVENSLLGS
jgi:uncharacterized membrane protein